MTSPEISADELLAFLRQTKPGHACSISYKLAQVFITHLTRLAAPEYREMERAARELARIDHGRGSAVPTLVQAEWNLQKAALAWGRTLPAVKDKTPTANPKAGGET